MLILHSLTDLNHFQSTHVCTFHITIITILSHWKLFFVWIQQMKKKKNQFQCEWLKLGITNMDWIVGSLVAWLRSVIFFPLSLPPFNDICHRFYKCFVLFLCDLISVWHFYFLRFTYVYISKCDSFFFFAFSFLSNNFLLKFNVWTISSWPIFAYRIEVNVSDFYNLNFLIFPIKKYRVADWACF